MQKDISRLCIHTITNKPWKLETAIERYSKKGIKGITLWRDSYEGKNLKDVKRQIEEAGLKIVSVCRGGFFPARNSAERKKALEENYRIIDEAAELGAPLIVLVCGSSVEQSLAESRKQISDALQVLVKYAESKGVCLAIEPLHPMYADTRSAINTLKQANDLCEQIISDYIGVAVDIYHLWWDPELEPQIIRCGKLRKIFAFHICDWKTPTVDMLNDRGLMGEGCIPIRQIHEWVERAGFSGFIEVEIFSNHYWKMDQNRFLKMIIQSYKKNI